MSALDLTSFSCSFGHPSFCHFEPSRLPRPSHGEGGRNLLLLLIYVKLCGPDETDTAAHNRHIYRNTIRRTCVTVAGRLFFSLGNISPSKHARSRHRSEKRADVRRQRASRNSRLSRRHQENRGVFL